MYNNYHTVPKPAPREFLTAADAAIEFLEPLAAGADGVFVWGAVDVNGETGERTVTTNCCNSSFAAEPLQLFVDSVLEVLAASAMPTPPPSTIPTPAMAPTTASCNISAYNRAVAMECSILVQGCREALSQSSSRADRMAQLCGGSAASGVTAGESEASDQPCHQLWACASSLFDNTAGCEGSWAESGSATGLGRLKSSCEDAAKVLARRANGADCNLDATLMPCT
jgi:hypothetical protein